MPPTVAHRSEFVYRIILLAALLAMVVASVGSLRPPSRDNDRFSTDAALAHLNFIASETHPVGLPHHKAVHEYLMNEFARLGYVVQSQDAISAIPLRNVVARRAGQVAGNKAVMLAAHYDSVRWGPGAGDDSAAVAALLEVARDMSTGFYRNDIIFLITDGEELGLWGAKLFVNEHPWANDVGVVLNFDARGTSGPSIMFETSNGNAWMIDQFSQVDPHPVCASLTQEVYQQMPNRTDFTIFREKMPGLNFAFIGSYSNYHTENDDLKHLSIASMRHHGIQALALAEKLAQEDLTQASGKADDIYFDILSRYVVKYSQQWAPWIALAVSFAAIVLVVLAVRNEATSISRLSLGCGVLILNLVMVGGLGWTLLCALRRVALNQYADWGIVSFTLVACAITVAIFYAIPKLSSVDLAASGLVFWTLLTLLSGTLERGASYLTAWPLLFAAIGFGFTSLLSKRFSFLRMLVLAVCAMPSALLLPRVIYLAFLGMKVTGVINVGQGTMPVLPFLLILIVLVMWLLPLQLGPSEPVLPQPPESA